MAPYTVSLFASRLSLVAVVVSAAMLFSCTGPTYGSLVPALYVFGDSTADVGNVAVNQHYGIDRNSSSFQPRFSNGFVIPDFIAMMLELPLVPPSKYAQNSTTGINYAFAASGILPETHPGTWGFDIQIGNFSSSIANDLSKTFNQTDQLSYHLSHSIFLISFGLNDYFANYIPPFSAPLLPIQPVAFAQKLAGALSDRLTALYNLGARKFLVRNIWPMGCLPEYHVPGVCNDTINNSVRPYSELMPQMLQRLASNLSGFDFSYSDDFAFVDDLNLDNKTTGITNTTEACWDFPRNNDVCQNRNKYVYFDIVHTTQVVNKLFVLKCFNGTLCSPKNIIELSVS